MNNKLIRVLYIEDNPGHARLLMRRLEKNGKFHVDWAEEPIGGLKKAKQKHGHYDVILVDYNLSGKSGLEVISKINTYENAPPTIMITASGSEEVAVQALHSGADNYVVKDTDNNYLELMPLIIFETIHKRQLGEDKKKAEEELKQLNALLRAEQEAINSGILVVDLEGKILRYTKRFLEIWNIPESLAKEGKDECAKQS